VTATQDSHTQWLKSSSFGETWTFCVNVAIPGPRAATSDIGRISTIMRLNFKYSARVLARMGASGCIAIANTDKGDTVGAGRNDVVMVGGALDCSGSLFPDETSESLEALIPTRCLKGGLGFNNSDSVEYGE